MAAAGDDLISQWMSGTLLRGNWKDSAASAALQVMAWQPEEKATAQSWKTFLNTKQKKHFGTCSWRSILAGQEFSAVLVKAEKLIRLLIFYLLVVVPLLNLTNEVEFSTKGKSPVLP